MKKRFITIIISILLFVTLTACDDLTQTDKKKFTVTFNSSGGSEVISQTVEKGKLVEEPEIPVMEGHHFLGWYFESEEWNFSEDVVTEDIQLWARWRKNEYEVTFYNQNDTPTTTKVQVLHNEKVVEPVVENVVGYNFLGWYYNDELYDFDEPVTSDLLLKAKWESIPSLTVIVNYIDDEVTMYVGETKKITPNVSLGKDVSNFTLSYNLTNEIATVDENGNVTAIAGGTVILTAKGNDVNETSDSIVINIKEYCTVTFTNNGTIVESINVPYGGMVTRPDNPTNGKYTFLGWYQNGDDYDFNFNTPIKYDITLEAKWSEPVYTSKWTPNQQTNDWDGKGMSVKILVDNLSEYDPFNSNYDASDKTIKQRQQRMVEKEYNVEISYKQYDDSAAWGPSRIKYIKENTASGKFAEDDVYVVNIASSWIPTLVKENCLAALYDTNTQEGIFNEIGYAEQPDGSYTPAPYDQGETSNSVVSVMGKVYGYVQEDPRPDYFLYYNADLIASVGMEDPAELWLKGQWTWSNFEKYAADLQTALSAKGSDHHALAIRPAEFVVGSTTATGSKIASIQGRATLSLTSTNVLDRFAAIQSIFSKGYCENVGQSDTPTSFLESRSAIVHGSLWFIGAANRFDPSKCTFTIGSVPYPTADGAGGNPITTNDASEAIIGYDGMPVEVVEGSGTYIKGVDMSESSYIAPYSSLESFSIIDIRNGKNGISNKVIFAILYDLYEGLGEDPVTGYVDKDTAYRNFLLTKFDKELYIDVIMSVQGRTYFELIDLLSMTVGSGTYFSENSFYTIADTICINASISAPTKLNEIVDKYKDAMAQLGYQVA